MSSPHPDGLGARMAMAAALDSAGIAADDIDYINLHGTATRINDAVEGSVVRSLFTKPVACSSVKGWTGHTLGAAGAIEAVAAVLAITGNFIPPTIHLTTPDPECDLDYVAEGARRAELDVVLSNSFAFGGNNTAVVFGKFTDSGVSHD